MTHDTTAYGLWFLVAINSIVFILFAFSFTHQKTGRDWRCISSLPTRNTDVNELDEAPTAAYKGK